MTGRTLLGEIRTILFTALACIVFRSVLRIAYCVRLRFYEIRTTCLLHLAALIGFLPAVAAKEARRRELAKLVAYHILGDIHRHVPAPIVDGNCVADHLREDRGRA